MSENNEQENKKIQIPLERHKWPDEIEAERRQRRSKLISYGVFALVFALLGILIGVKSASHLNTTFGMNKIGEVEKILAENWYFGKDMADVEEYLSDKSLKGMVNFPDIDKHSTYMSREEMEQYSQSLSGSYVGIGIQYYQDDNDRFIVRKVFPASPAAKAGVEPGDILVSVDGKDLKGQDLDGIKALVLGEEGTEVEIGVIRAGQDKVFKMDRAEVSHSVNYDGKVAHETGYVELTQFGDNTASEVEYVLQEFQKQGLKHLIIDLRDNGGGYLTSVVDIAGYFLGNDEVVLYQQIKSGEIQAEKTKTKKQYKFDEIIILVNENTASASEVLVAALQHHLEHVAVVGTKSYGKGTVQSTKVLGDGSAVKYTVAEWLTPGEKKINSVGITPDHIVKLHPVLETVISEFKDGSVYEIDEVDSVVKTSQLALDFLGYDLKRQDGYFDHSTQEALQSFQRDHKLKADGKLDRNSYEVLTTTVIREWNLNQNKYDFQMKKAVSLIDVS